MLVYEFWTHVYHSMNAVFREKLITVWVVSGDGSKAGRFSGLYKYLYMYMVCGLAGPKSVLSQPGVVWHTCIYRRYRKVDFFLWVRTFVKFEHLRFSVVFFSLSILPHTSHLVFFFFLWWGNSFFFCLRDLVAQVVLELLILVWLWLFLTFKNNFIFEYLPTCIHVHHVLDWCPR